MRCDSVGWECDGVTHREVGPGGRVTEVEAAVAELLNESVHLVDLAVFSVEFLLAGAASPSQLAHWRETNITGGQGGGGGGPWRSHNLNSK